MCDEKHPGLVPYDGPSRREFTLMAAATTAIGIGGAACAAVPAPAERDVRIRTPDGTADAALFSPNGKAKWPGVLLWPDINGLRPATRDMGRRLAGQGYVVLVVNQFYRSGDAATVAVQGSGQDPAQRERKNAMRALLTEAAVDRDAAAFVAWLDALKETSAAKIGVQGYCMGGAMAFRTAAAAPRRIGAVGSFHGGGLVTDKPTSPHLLIARTNADFLVAVAKNDDANEPTAKDVLRETFRKERKKAVVEVYGGDHGWCVPDSARYNQPEAERAWSALTALYKKALV